MISLRSIFVAVSLAAAAPFATPPAAAQTDLPRLQKQGEATQLIVDGKPFLVLGGELRNSSSSSLEFMKPVWPRLAEMHLNTVLASVSWELLEPQESKFDYTLVDGLIKDARSNHLHLVFLWFGSWKNTYSSYVPAWVKQNQTRFPRVTRANGAGTERLSPFSDEAVKADSNAFAALMRHIKEVDGQVHTVLMIQVENEMGVIPESRDHSPVAEAAFSAPVPKPLMDYMESHKDGLIPEFRAVWENAGGKEGNWQTVFGSDPITDDLFMAWQYATYINRVVEAGKKEYPIPMYANAALIRPNYKPGQYNSGGPLPHSIDIYRAGAPNIDFVSPDIYFPDFINWASLYHRNGNPLFIPEASADQSAANAFYAFGKLDGIGISPFAIDSLAVPGAGARGVVPEDPQSSPLARTYSTLEQLAPLILEHQGKGDMTAILVENADSQSNSTQLGPYTIKLSQSRTAFGSTNAARYGMLIISVGPDEFLLAGGPGNLNVNFSYTTGGPDIVGVASVDEGRFENGKWIAGRRLNGDENSQGQLARITTTGSNTIFRVKLYNYR